MENDKMKILSKNNIAIRKFDKYYRYLSEEQQEIIDKIYESYSNEKK
jgi:hypothetical protein